MNIKSVTTVVLVAVFVFVSEMAIAKSNQLSDDQVKQRIIDDSIASYPGTCAGGASPICYKKEISKAMIKEWHQQNL